MIKINTWRFIITTKKSSLSFILFAIVTLRNACPRQIFSVQGIHDVQIGTTLADRFRK